MEALKTLTGNTIDIYEEFGDILNIDCGIVSNFSKKKESLLEIVKQLAIEKNFFGSINIVNTDYGKQGYRVTIVFIADFESNNLKIEFV